MDVGLAQIVDRLDHDLEEIRVRSFIGIMAKLEIGLLKEEQLLGYQPDLVEKLIKWFGFPTVPKKEEIFKLILRLAQTATGAKLLLKADPGLLVLTQIASDSNNPVLDQILAEISLLVPLESTKSSQSSHKSPQLSRSSKRSSISDAPANEGSLNSNEDSVSFALWWWLPWCKLADCDMQVLSSVLASLHQNPLQAAHFTSKVMLHDFPPQIFLQHPSMIRTLLKLVNGHGGDVSLAAIACLKELTSSLFKQILLNTDPQFVTFMLKQDRADSIPCVVGESRTNSPTISENSRIVHYVPTTTSISSNKSSEGNCAISIPEFCCMVLESLVGVSGQLSLASATLTLFKHCIPQPVNVWTSDHAWAQSIRTSLDFILRSLASQIHSAYSIDPMSRVEAAVMTWMVMKTVVPIEICATVVPKDLQQAVTDCLLDPILFILYPHIHMCFEMLAKEFKYNFECGELFQSFGGIKELAASIEHTANFIRYHGSMDKTSALTSLTHALKTLHCHQQYSIIEDFIHLATNKWDLSDCEVDTCCEILVGMLTDTDMKVVVTAYQAAYRAVAAVLGPQACLSTLPISLGILLDPRFLSELVTHGLTSKNDVVRSCSENTLLMMLKCDAVVSKRCWSNIMSHLSQVLPLLEAFAHKSTPLGRSVLRLLDPDVASTIPLSPMEILMGNIRVLMSKDSLCRDEAISRILFLLHLDPEKEGNYHFNNLRFPDNPITAKQTLNGIYEAGCMVRVLELLVSPGVDSKVVKSALVQLSLMTDDDKLHDTFIEQGGLAVVRDQLKRVIKNKTEECKYLYGTIVIILRNIAKYNIDIRFEFSKDYNLVVSILLGLIMFEYDWRVQRDTAQVLMLIAYADFITITSLGDVSFPDIISQRVKLPFMPVSHSLSAKYSLKTVGDAPLRDKRVATLLSVQWLVARTEGGVSEVVKKEIPSSIAANECGVNGGISSVPLGIPLRELRSCHLAHNVTRLLISLSSATSHTSAIEAILALNRYIDLYSVTCTPEARKGFSKLPWEENMSRFLETPPASIQDQQLLLAILRFLSMATNSLPCLLPWVAELLKDPTQTLARPLTQLTADDTTTLKKELCIELLVLVEKCMKIPNLNKVGWDYLISTLDACLSNSHSQQFYSLGLLDTLLRCIAGVSRRLEGWSSVSVGSQASFPPRFEASLLWRLLAAFHCSSPRSYMGLTITRLTVTCLNHLLQHSISKRTRFWEKQWLVKEVKWLGEVLKCGRDPLLKAFTLQLASGLCLDDNATSFLVSIMPEAFTTALGILLDDSEPSLTRTHAANLCSNIIHNSNDKTLITICSEEGLYRSVAVQVNSVTFHRVLSVDQIRDLQVKTSKPYNDCNIENLSECDRLALIKEEYESGGMVTCELITSSCRLMINLLNLDRQNVELDIEKQGLRLALFRCLSDWRNRSRGSVLRDNSVVEAFSEVCNLLVHCIFVYPLTPSSSPAHHPLPKSVLAESLATIIWLLQVSTYGDEIKENHRLCIWKSALKLLGSLSSRCSSAVETDQAFIYLPEGAADGSVLPSVVPPALVDTLCLCIKTVSPHGLQSAALNAVPAVAPSLSPESSELLVTALMSEWDKLSSLRSLRWALSSILSCSHAGTAAALRQGLPQLLLDRLRQSHIALTVMPQDTGASVSRNKKSNIVLSSMAVDLALLSNMLASCCEAKELCAVYGLADILHKLWAWCLLDFALLVSLIQSLITFTAMCPQGGLSLVLTSTMVGVGQRKTPTSNSILHAALNLLSKEVYPVLVKRSLLELATHACQAQESRNVLSKSNIMVEFLKLFKNKKFSSSDELESAWFEFLIVFSSYAEGQALLIKNDTIMIHLVDCIGLNRSRSGALSILRNLSINPTNRLKFITSNKLLTLLSERLLDNSIPERELQDIALITWSITANSQRAKAAVKSVALDSRLQFTLTAAPLTSATSSLINRVINVIRQ